MPYPWRGSRELRQQRQGSRVFWRPRRSRLLAVPRGRRTPPRSPRRKVPCRTRAGWPRAASAGSFPTAVEHRTALLVARGRLAGAVLGPGRGSSSRYAEALDGAAGRVQRAHAVHCAAAGHHRHVAGEAAARRVEQLRVAPEREEDVLHDVLGGGLVAEHPHGAGECPGAMCRVRAWRTRAACLITTTHCSEIPIQNVEVLNGLTIGQLAELTGVQPGTLRMWEARHGFPRAERLPSGHRRYAEADVERVLEVVRARDGGLSLAAAVERLDAGRRPGAGDLDLRGAAPAPPRAPPLSDPQAPARGGVARDRGRVLGAREPRRARGLLPARVVLPRRRAALARVRTQRRAGAGAGRLREAGRPRGAPFEVPIGRDHPLANEWAIVCDAPGFSACLAGRERQVTGERVFEVLWSVEPEVVRDAARIGLDLAIARHAGAGRARAGAPVAAARPGSRRGGGRHLRHEPDPRLRSGGAARARSGRCRGRRARAARAAPCPR